MHVGGDFSWHLLSYYGNAWDLEFLIFCLDFVILHLWVGQPSNDCTYYSGIYLSISHVGLSQAFAQRKVMSRPTPHIFDTIWNSRKIRLVPYDIHSCTQVRENLGSQVSLFFCHHFFVLFVFWLPKNLRKKVFEQIFTQFKGLTSIFISGYKNKAEFHTIIYKKFLDVKQRCIVETLLLFNQ